ncbi:MAG TPA: hypothetical protein VNE39_17815 [Planctomycetota bacterium]|nr:hypothetical protein [Planctomycetota bacterium]
MARRVLLAVAALGMLAADARATIIHCYLLDGNANDSVGTANGTVKNYGGLGGWTTGKFGQAFNGTSSGFISFPSTGIPLTQGTFVQWVRIATNAGAWDDPLASPVWDTQAGSPDPMRHEIHSAYIPRVYSVPNGASGSGTIARPPRPSAMASGTSG